MPKFKEIAGSFSVTLPLIEPVRRVEINTGQGEILKLLTLRQKEILEVLKHGPLSRQEIGKKLKQSPSARIIQMDLARLSALEMVVKSGGKAGRFSKWSINQ